MVVPAVQRGIGYQLLQKQIHLAGELAVVPGHTLAEAECCVCVAVEFTGIPLPPHNLVFINNTVKGPTLGQWD